MYVVTKVATTVCPRAPCNKLLIKKKKKKKKKTINLKKDLTGEIEMEKKTSVPGEVERATLRRVNLGRPK